MVHLGMIRFSKFAFIISTLFIFLIFFFFLVFLLMLFIFVIPIIVRISPVIFVRVTIFDNSVFSIDPILFPKEFWVLIPQIHVLRIAIRLLQKAWQRLIMLRSLNLVKITFSSPNRLLCLSFTLQRKLN